MSPRSVFVTGANRGIGLGLVKEFLKNKDIQHVFATCRNPDEAKDLKAISDSRLHIVKMDVACDESIKAAYKKVDAVVGAEGLNLLVNNAGVFADYKTEQEPDRKTIARVIDTNAIGVAVISQVFIPLLKRAAEHSSSLPEGVSRAAIVTISSTAGSIEKTGAWTVGLLAYRMSKVAVNSLSKTLAVDLEKYGIITTAFCPGWVKTDMGGERAQLTLEDSMNDLVPTIYKLEKKDSGCFYDRHGVVIPY